MGKKRQYFEKNINFLKEMAAMEGVKALQGGVLYEVISRGEGGRHPELRDVVSIYYQGSLIDGKVFDDNTAQGFPDAFRLRELIEGWQIALPRMSVGDKWRIYVPSERGYGAFGAPPDIPGYSTLIFEIELVAIA